MNFNTNRLYLLKLGDTGNIELNFIRDYDDEYVFTNGPDTLQLAHGSDILNYIEEADLGLEEPAPFSFYVHSPSSDSGYTHGIVFAQSYNQAEQYAQTLTGQQAIYELKYIKKDQML